MGFAEPNTGLPDGTLTTSNSPRTVGGGNARLFVVAIYGQMKLNFVSQRNIMITIILQQRRSLM